MTDYLQLAKEIVQRATRDGVQAEALIMDDVSTTLRVDGGEVEQLSQSGSKGLGVRVIDGGKVGYAYTSDFSDEGIQTTINAAHELAQIATPDEFRALPQLQTIPDEDLEIYDPALETVTTSAKVDLAKQAERQTFEADSRIFHAQANYGDSITHVYLANSNGFAGKYSRTTAYAYVFATAKDKDLNDSAQGFGLDSSPYFSELSAVKIGQESAYTSTLTLGGKTVPTQKTTVVFDPMVMTQIIGTLAFAMRADSLQRGRSFLIGKQGTEVGSDKVTLLDNGRMKRGLASAPFDAEGVPTSATRLMDEGIFQNVIYDTYSARMEGGEAFSTGNAQRGSHRNLPGVGPSNFYLQPGILSRDEIIAGIDDGFYITNVMQTGGISPVTGDCSMAASGKWIKNGKLTDPINGVTVATTLNELLKNISEVGNDLRMFPFMGSLGSPTVRVDNVIVGGSVAEAAPAG
ncbi:MAG: TldD/PmbA family protein [Aggregatilineales bacterium]